MLANENPTPNTQTVDAYRETITQMRVRQFANELIKGEREPDPRELPNPSAPGATRVRRIDMERSCTMSRVNITQECRDHNSRVSGIGKPELFEHLWEKK